VSDLESFDPDLAAKVYLASCRQKQLQEGKLAALEDLVATHRKELQHLHRELGTMSKQNEQLIKSDKGMLWDSWTAALMRISSVVCPIILYSVPS
jgi:hypothetical protein